MSDFSDYIIRTDAQASLPEELAGELVAGVAKACAALSLGHQVPMSVLQEMLPAVETLPDAEWVVPDATPSSLIQTTKMTMSLNPIIAYDLSSIVVVPQNVLDDSRVAIWDEVVRPRVSESLAKKLDNGAIFGVGAPASANPSVLEFIALNSGGRLAKGAALTSGSTVVADTSASAADVGQSVFGTGIPSGATVASVSAGVSFTMSAGHAATATGTGNALVLPADPAYFTQADVFGTSADSAANVLDAARRVAECSYNPSAGWTAPGWAFRQMAARTQELTANPVGSDATPLVLGGLPIRPDSVVWNSAVDAIVGDWSALKIGIRKDIEMTLHTEGVISDDTGTVTINLLQSRQVALRTVARYSWVVLQPPVADDSFVGQRSIFAAVQNTGTAGRVGGPLRTQGASVPLTTPVSGTSRSGRRR